MAGKSKSAKMGHSKFSKFNQGDSAKAQYTCGGSVCQGYTVISPQGEVVAQYENMWDAIDHKLKLNTPS